jgi:hypothetical protein
MVKWYIRRREENDTQVEKFSEVAYERCKNATLCLKAPGWTREGKRYVHKRNGGWVY